MFGLNQLINCPTRVTSNTSTLTDRILTNTRCNISQHDLIDAAISDHSMAYCSRKISKVKYNKHDGLNFRSMKNYSSHVYKESLKRVSFPSYENRGDPGTAYNNFIARLDYVLKVLAPFRNVRVKDYSSEMFNGEIEEKIHKRDKLYKISD